MTLVDRFHAERARGQFPIDLGCMRFGGMYGRERLGCDDHPLHHPTVPARLKRVGTEIRLLFELPHRGPTGL